jgi:Tol biopolymer transport system component
MDTLKKYYPWLSSLVFIAILGIVFGSFDIRGSQSKNTPRSTATLESRSVQIQFKTNVPAPTMTPQAVAVVMEVDSVSIEMETQEVSQDSNPSWSPDGQWIAFTTNRDSPRDIYLMHPDGSDTRRLQSSPGSDGSVVWSPDSQWITFSTYADNVGYYQTNIHRMRPTDYLSRNLSIGTTVGEKDPSWSPDGQWIAFVGYHHSQGVPSYSEIFRMRADGSERQRLTYFENYTGNYISKPSWSPDGQWILFEANGALYLMRCDGSGLRQLTQSVGSVPAWSPDGYWVAFEADGNIYLMHPDGSGLQQMTQNLAADWNPQWSPDSQWILFSSERDGNRELYLLRVDGSILHNVTQNAAQDEKPSWSPDGQWIVFSSNREGDWDIYLTRMDGSELYNLTVNN